MNDLYRGRVLLLKSMYLFEMVENVDVDGIVSGEF
jgi:hypothetical protein